VLEPLFRSDGSHFVPSAHARGPWDENALHGGPVAALIARAVERLDSEGAMQAARFTMEILRPVPLRPLEVAARVLRPGRRVQLAGATVSAAGVELCTASIWRIRLQEMIPDGEREEPLRGAARDQEPEPPPPPDSGVIEQDPSWPPAFHSTGVEMRFVGGHFVAPGPATVWIRLRGAVVDDEIPTPLMRTVAAADFGNGVSALLDWSTTIFVNTELTVHLFRPPGGEWVALDARTHLSGRGVGLAASALFDQSGLIGRSAQALFVARQ
jgi:hypothetical protein